MKIYSPAKINLFLHITGQRSDGYHNLISLMCCIGLYDTISLDIGTRETSVSCNHPHVPEDETNLALGAASLFYERLEKHEGLKISIQKEIPVAAGLGGGSSNAAAVFLGLNRYYGYPFPENELMSMALSIGADVPFFIIQRPALAAGIGEKLKVYNELKKHKILLIFPGFNVSTAEVYKNLNLGLTKCKKKLKQFLLNKQSFDPMYHLCNDLEMVVASKYPVIQSAKKALMHHGASGALMSGSGPTVFGLFSDSDKASRARHAIARMKKWQLCLTDMITQDTGFRIYDT